MYFTFVIWNKFTEENRKITEEIVNMNHSVENSYRPVARGYLF